MSHRSIGVFISLAPLLLSIRVAQAGGDVYLKATVEQDGTATWHTSGIRLTKNGSALWAYLTVTNMSRSSVRGTRFFAKFLDARGRECFSLLFAQELTANGEDSEPFRPDETRDLFSGTGSIFPSVAPASVQLWALPELPRDSPAVWFESEPISVPPTIMGGTVEGQNIVGDRQYPNPYLGVASVAIDAGGAVTRSVVMKAVSIDLRDKLSAFVKSLRFNPAIHNGGFRPAQIYLIFVRRDSPAFSDRSTWIWENPWIINAAIPIADREPVPVVTELAFEPRSDNSDGRSGFEYFPLGSDWCPDLFTWAESPESGRLVRRWNPGWVLKNVHINSTH